MTDLQATPLLLRRAAQPRDTAMLRELFADAHDDLLVLPPDTRDVIVDMQFRALRRRQQLEHPAARRELLLVDGVVAGQLLLAEEIATVHLIDITVRHAWRGRGLGSRVLAEVLADADATHRVVRARPCESDRLARGWLEHRGFLLADRGDGAPDLVRIPAVAA